MLTILTPTRLTSMKDRFRREEDLDWNRRASRLSRAFTTTQCDLLVKIRRESLTSGYQHLREETEDVRVLSRDGFVFWNAGFMAWFFRYPGK